MRNILNAIIYCVTQSLIYNVFFLLIVGILRTMEPEPEISIEENF